MPLSIREDPKAPDRIGIQRGQRRRKRIRETGEGTPHDAAGAIE